MITRSTSSNDNPNKDPHFLYQRQSYRKFNVEFNMEWVHAQLNNIHGLARFPLPTSVEQTKHYTVKLNMIRISYSIFVLPNFNQSQSIIKAKKVRIKIKAKKAIN